VNKAPFVLVAIFAATCATTSEREVDRQCGAQGRRFVAEAYGVGGLGPVAPPPVPRDRDPRATGGARYLMPLTGLRERTIGLGNLGRIRAVTPPAPEPPPKPAPAGLVLRDVQLAHAEVGRGGEVDGVVRYASHAGAKVELEATATVDGYGWKIEVPASEWRAGFWVRCLAGRPRQVVDWSFRLRDSDGHQSEAITRPLTCTGAPLPGGPPRLEEVELQQQDIVAGWSSSGWARFSGTSPPLQLIARSATRGYGWTDGPVNGSPARTGFQVECREERGVHTVIWQFVVRDTYGRESNVIERPMNCGLCL
jgi:hypothetical protein